MKKIIASLVLGLVASVSFAAGPAPHPHTPPVKHEVVKPVHKAHIKHMLNL